MIQLIIVIIIYTIIILHMWTDNSPQKGAQPLMLSLWMHGTQASFELVNDLLY